jgi:Na+-transporting NADH:ubiquinone oxidoreductase subunit NqrF
VKLLDVKIQSVVVTIIVKFMVVNIVPAKKRLVKNGQLVVDIVGNMVDMIGGRIVKLMIVLRKCGKVESVTNIETRKIQE